MKSLVQKIRTEVRAKFMALRFIPTEGVFIEGDWSAIEIVPNQKPNSLFCDLHFRIIPYRQRRDVSEEILEGIREAWREALNDDNPNVRYAAHGYLDQENIEERVESGDLEGWAISCYAETEPSVNLCFDEVTNHRGELWFSNVLKNSVCRLTLSHRSALARYRRPTESSGLVQRARSLQAAASSDQARPHGETKPVEFKLVDGRLVVVLEETTHGEAVLTFETLVQEIGDAVVRFSFGTDNGQVQLTPAGPKPRWSAQIKLRRLFRDVVSETPEFEILPARK